MSKQGYGKDSGQFGCTDNKQFSGVRDFKSPGCVLSCCKSCSYCSFTRASTKERSKSRSLSEQNKACQRCFFSKSMSFCPSCSQCPQCCRRTDCRGTIATVLVYLARNGCESSSGFGTEGWLFPSFQSEAPLDKGSFSPQWLRKSYQKPFPQRGFARFHRETGSGKGGYQVVSGFLQPAFSCPQTEQKVEANLRSKSVKSVFEGQFLQDGNSGDDPVVFADRGMGNLAGLQRCIFPHSDQPKVKKVSQVLPEQPNLPIHSSPFWFGHSFPRVYKGGQRSETDGAGQGYPNPPIPRRLVAENPVPGNLPTRYPDPLGPLPKVRLGSQHEEIRVGTPANLQFCRLPVRPFIRSGPSHSGPVDSSPRKIKIHQELEQLHSQTVHVSDRAADSHGETSFVGTSSYEADSMAFGKSLACPRSSRESHSGSPFTPSTPRVVVRLRQCTGGAQPLHPLQHALQLFTDTSNKGWGAHLGDSIARGVWSPIESRLHINFLELKAVLLALKKFEHLCRDQIVLVATDNTTVVSYINKQGGMKSGSLCALLWRLLSWCHPRGIVLRARHIPGHLNVIADKLSKHNQVIQTEWSLSQQVFNLLCSRWAQPQVDLFATRFNHKLPQFVSPVPDPTAWAVDALSLPWGNLDVFAFPLVSRVSQAVAKMIDQGCRRMILIAPGWPNMPWFWDLVNLSV